MKNICILIIVMMALSGCDKFLDVRPVDQKPTEIALSNSTGLNEVLRASYITMQSSNLYGETLYKYGEEFGDNLDFGYIYDNAIKLRNFGKFDAVLGTIWNNAYSAIYRANIAINAVDNNAFPGSSNLTGLKGEGLFIRALMHFELVRFFAQPYSNSPTTNPGVVIRITAPTANQTQVAASRSTVAEVYTQVIADLKSAQLLLPGTNIEGRATSWAAQALLARVYFSMNDFTNAALYSTNVIQGMNTPYLADSTNANAAALPFRNMGAPATYSPGGVIFQIINQLGSDGRANLTGDFWSQSASSINLSLDTTGSSLDPNTNNSVYSDLKHYGGRRFDSLIVKVDPSTNVQLGIKGPVSRPYSIKFRGPDKLAASPINIPVIRMAEMYLTLAESDAELGLFSDARKNYNYIRAMAGLPADVSTPDGSLRDRIRVERRVEFVLENDRYHELRRQKSTNIRGFSYDSPKILLLPIDETNGNVNIQQN